VEGDFAELGDIAAAEDALKRAEAGEAYVIDGELTGNELSVLLRP